MAMNREKIISLIGISRFIEAYERILSELEKNPGDPEAIELSKQLSASIRNRCIDLACNKGTEMSPETYETEALLRLVIRLNGESIYG